ncbi:TetR/AcrR family transcriptional regulator [Patulibacter brassicae]|jgi:AcrR family transcriptional regulator|uniref:TetR/AcrR family transcriptional regulator n=1 Tax=Patulibacter brassicae TaxID=1705717 RepID=A0ABU4VRS8_9ACTN|nr:TetR/AcrR family transcriptional regulator [Patulibacter brassicae]MDX8153603.1 TetR/AcrR family transcriptional regulator [Patulibacter brassicae]
MPTPQAPVADAAQTRDRLLAAAAELLEEAAGEDVSTRAICDRAGVRSPTLYHHFGSKEGLLDAVVSHGLREFLDAADEPPADDPVAHVREAWDLHVRFGLENPSFYALVYGRTRPGRPCAVVADLRAMVLRALEPAARHGRLRVTPEDAAAQIVAAGSGVALALIAQPPEHRDLGLSTQVRDAILASLTTAPGSRSPRAPTTATAAVGLAATLSATPEGFSDAEAALLRDWLHRLAGGG